MMDIGVVLLIVMIVVAMSMDSLIMIFMHYIYTGGLLFKAQPILIKDPYPAKTATTPVQCTTPFSPNLRTKARSMMRSSVDSVGMNNNYGGGVENQNGRDITIAHQHASSTKHISSVTTKTIISTRPPLLDATSSHQSNVLATAIQML
jgi:hypothetical protein